MNSAPIIQGMAELLARLKSAPQAISSKVDAELSDGAQSIAAEAKQRAPADQGILRNEIGAGKVGPLNYEVFSGADYSPFVEFGTLEKADIPPGLEDYAAQFKGDFANGTYSSGSGLSFKEMIFAWCERKGIEKALWYPIFVSIAIHGTQAQPFFFPAVNRITPIIIDRVNRALDTAI